MRTQWRAWRRWLDRISGVGTQCTNCGQTIGTDCHGPCYDCPRRRYEHCHWLWYGGVNRETA